MKKILYGTTALVTAGVLAASPASAEEKIKLGLGGYMNNYLGVGGIDEASTETRNFNGSGLFSDGEIHFKGETTLDNGITFGAQVQLESYQSDPDQIDENYGYMEGSFGRLIFGSENSAAYLMQYGAPGVGVPVNSGWVTVFIPVVPGGTASFRSPAVSTYLDYGNDENQLTYFTPRFNGFQLGVSYAPAVVGTGDGKNYPVEADKNTEYYNGISVGANFVQSFNGVDIALAGGYRRADVSKTNKALGFDDLQQFSGGLNVSFAGFTVGGSYASESDGQARSGGTASTEGHAWDVGATYSTGPWGVGVTYIQTVVQGSLTNKNDDEMKAIEAGVSYAVGPGITASVSALYGKWEDEAGADQDGTVGVVGLKFGF